MNFTESSQQLAKYILSLQSFNVGTSQTYGYTHMGAIISDAILQAGMNYRTVVAPRVNSILKTYPDAQTTSRFHHVLNTHGANTILQWKHHEKPQRVFRLTEFFLQQTLDTDAELRTWLSFEPNTSLLRQIKGIGPKTIDYLKNLVGLPTVAVDRHIRTFLFQAGVYLKGYEEIRQVVSLAATSLNVSPSHIDHAIWLHMSAG